MKLLTRIEDVWICELDDLEVAAITGKSGYQVGDDVAVVNQYDEIRKVEALKQKYIAAIRRIERAEQLAAMLNQDIERARLDVSYGVPPQNIRAIKTLVKSLTEITED